ncbi:MAG TPA: SdpI family protein [Thermoanaerobaculia bacterium]|nr:SdpI family protein [Thermoanaerobaculia bacterium]
MKIAAVTLIITAFALSAALYAALPASIPIHWNAAGAVDHESPKIFGAFLMPGMMLVIAALFASFPIISPRGFEIDPTGRAYRAILLAVLTFMLAVHVFVLLSAIRGFRFGPFAMPTLIGALLVIIGAFLPQLPRNFFIGIRTPWTLADQNVWNRTHRFGGPLFIICGALLVTIGPFLRARASTIAMISVILISALASVVYSFIIYRWPDVGFRSP